VTVLQEHLVHVAPPPILTRLERLNHRVLGLVKMLSGMLVLGGVATTHVAAFETQSQVNPSVAHLEAFLAAFTSGGDLLDVFLMSTGFGHKSPQNLIETETALPHSGYSSRKRSDSIAAIQPVPAAVMACR
jgi:hypothetical protein